jgi:hypothetical protein
LKWKSNASRAPLTLQALRQADRIISDYHGFFITKEKDAIKDKVQYEAEKKVLYRLAKREAAELRQNYQELCQKYPFPLDRMLEEMTVPPFLAGSISVMTHNKRKRQHREHDLYI